MHFVIFFDYFWFSFEMKYKTSLFDFDGFWHKVLESARIVVEVQQSCKTWVAELDSQVLFCHSGKEAGFIFQPN